MLHHIEKMTEVFGWSLLSTVRSASAKLSKAKLSKACYIDRLANDNVLPNDLYPTGDYAVAGLPCRV